MKREGTEDIIRESTEVVVPHPESHTTTNYGTGPRVPQKGK